MFLLLIGNERTNERTNAAQWRLRERGALHAALLPYWCHAVLRGAPPTPVTVGPPLRPPPLPPLVAGVAGVGGVAAGGAGQGWRRSQHHALEHAAAMLRRLLLGGTRGADVVADLAVLAGGLLSPVPAPPSLGHGGGGGAAAAAAAAAAVAAAVAVTPVLGRLALAVPRGGVERLKRDIAPLSATQLVALLREAGADDC